MSEVNEQVTENNEQETGTDEQTVETYTTVKWEKGKIITAIDLNRMEQGILTAHNNLNQTTQYISDLNYADNGEDETVDGMGHETAAANTNFVSGVTQVSGQVRVAHRDFAPSVSIVGATSEAGENNSDKPRISISIAGNPATSGDINTATTDVYGVTKLSNTIDANVTNLATTPKAVYDAIDTTIGALKGANSGLAELDASGHVPANQLPSYVDDVIEGYCYNNIFYTEAEHINAIEGETGKIYVDLSTSNSYRWNQSTGYILISSTDKADKVANATSGNFAALDSNGNLTDSGHKHSDYITDISTKANKRNTVLETYLKMGVNCVASGDCTIAIGNQASATGDTTIAIGTQVSATDEYGIALGVATSANGEESIATGSHTVASGKCSYTGGRNTRAYGVCSHVFGEYNVKDDYDNILEWSPLTNYVVGDQIKRIIGSTTYTYTCIEPNNDSTFTSDHWELDNHTLYAEIVGNGYVIPGSEEGRSNARALDWRGNEYLKGNLYVNCNADSTNGTKVATITDIEVKANINNTILNTTLACGSNCTVSGTTSFAQGTNATANGNYSHALGQGVIASAANQSVVGKFNVQNNISAVETWSSSVTYNLGDIVKFIMTDAGSGVQEILYYKSNSNNNTNHTPIQETPHWSKIDYIDLIEIVGNGTSDSDRLNARALDMNGNERLKGGLYINCNDDSTGGIYIGGVTTGIPAFGDVTHSFQFSDGTDTVEFTMADLIALKDLLNN